MNAAAQLAGLAMLAALAASPDARCACDQAVVHGRVISVTDDGMLQASDGASGRIAWRTDLRAAITTPVVIAASSIYVATADGAVYRVESSAGAVQTSHRIHASLIPRGLTASDRALAVELVDAFGKCARVVTLDLALSERQADRACVER